MASGDVKRGKLNKWVRGAAFRVRRVAGKLLVDIKPNPRKARRKKKNSLAPRASRRQKRKVERRTGAALKRYIRSR